MYLKALHKVKSHGRRNSTATPNNNRKRTRPVETDEDNTESEDDTPISPPDSARKSIRTKKPRQFYDQGNWMAWTDVPSSLEQPQTPYTPSGTRRRTKTAVLPPGGYRCTRCADKHYKCDQDQQRSCPPCKKAGLGEKDCIYRNIPPDVAVIRERTRTGRGTPLSLPG